VHREKGTAGDSCQAGGRGEFVGLGGPVRMKEAAEGTFGKALGASQRGNLPKNRVKEGGFIGNGACRKGRLGGGFRDRKERLGGGV